MSKIALLTQWFDPEPTFKGLVFARELVRQGFEVEVITGFPNYPGGQLYPGYQMKWMHCEVIEGVKITRLPLYPSHTQSITGRILNYASFAASTLFYGLFLLKHCDVLYAYHPPLSVGIVASLIRKIRGVPVVYDIQDMWPDTLRATGMVNNAKALNFIGKLCDWVYRQVDHIVVLSPGFERLLIDRGVPANKIDVIYNWADEASLMSPTGKLPDCFLPSNQFRIVFAGNMGKAQALDTLIIAAKILQDRGSRVQFIMVGGGVEVLRLRKEVTQKQLENVKFLPSVPMAEVGLILSSADALLVHLRKDSLFEITIPSKTQAYMCIGRPIIMAVEGDAADLIRQSQGGVISESENPEVLAATAEKLASMPLYSLTDMGNRAKTFYDQNLALSVGAYRFGEIFKRYL